MFHVAQLCTILKCKSDLRIVLLHPHHGLQNSTPQLSLSVRSSGTGVYKALLVTLHDHYTDS